MRDPAEFLEDILVAARLAREYVSECADFTEFKANLQKRDAVVHRLEIIGEATNNLPGEVMDAIPSIPWRRVRDMRNFMVHTYWDINIQRVWSVVQDDLPTLIAAIEAYLHDR